jgi:trigger factor
MEDIRLEIRQFELGAKNVAAAKVVITKDKFETFVNEVYLKQRKNISLPGFRKGKAPRKMIEKFYGERIFWDDAINDNLGAALEFVVKEKELKPAAQAWIDKADYNEETKEVEIELSVPNYPVVELGQYKGLSAVKPAATVDEAAIDARIESVRERNGSVVTCDRPAKKGDTVVIDYVGYIDGTAFPGGKGENHSLELGSNSFIPGFEDQLVGAKAEEDREVNVTFPAEYHAEEFQNKDASFKVHVHEVKEKLLPQLDDDFAKDVSEFDTLAEYRDSIRKELQERADDGARDAFLDKLMEQITANTAIDLHESLIEDRKQQLIERQAARMGIDYETYNKLVGNDAEFTKTINENAEKNLRSELCLAEIGKLENVELTDEDKEREYSKLAENYGVDAESVKTFVDTAAFEHGVLLTKIADVIIANSTALEAEPEAEEKPAKAKKTVKAKASAVEDAEPKSKSTAKKKSDEAVADVPSEDKPKTARKPKSKKADTEEETK